MTGPTDAAQRPRRSDAERNHTLLLDAAAEAFAEHGLDTSINEIARRAGLGHGTVFRHFPSKEHLLVAILERKVARLQTIAEECAAEPDPWIGLTTFIERAVCEHAADRALMESVASEAAATELQHAVGDAKQQLLTTVGTIIDRARAAGVVRDDLTAGDIPIIVTGASRCACLAGHGHHDDPPARLLELTLDGIRPRARV